MRTILLLATVLVMTAILGPIVIIARLFGAREGEGSVAQRAMHLWARSLNWAAGVKLRVHGAEHIERSRGAIYVSNHVSWFDIFAIASILPRYSFIAKSELRKIPLFGIAAEAAGIVFIDRDNRKSAFESYKVASLEVRRGRSVVVCPEGTRGRDYHLRPFKKGPFVLAIAAQAPVVPTVVHGTLDVMRKGSFLIRSGVVDVHFFEPIETAGLSYEQRAELMERVWRRMADAMRDLYAVGTNEFPIAREHERTA
jgi:1-acyl-sn-glycerol-3-phosphate acyltransferase